MSFEFANAATLQATASIESSRFLEGTNLSDDSPAIAITADWTFDGGSFAGLDCYTSTVDISEGLDSGCDVYVGYFKPISRNQALSAQLTRHEYSNGLDHKWDFTDLAARWHINKKTRFTATYSRNWFDRPFDTFALKAETQIPLADKLSFNLSGTLMILESGAPVDELFYAKASLSYNRARWTTEAGLIYTDPDQIRMVPFDIDEPELLVTLSYRLY